MFDSAFANCYFAGCPQKPLVGINWYPATPIATGWRRCKRAAGRQGSQFVFRLPDEWEWQWAAGGGKRIYPWGDEEPDEKRTNYAGKVGQTTVVGAYPAGATPEGLMDMAGNVWEWQSNLYSK